jgi:hypothetical protein
MAEVVEGLFSDGAQKIGCKDPNATNTCQSCTEHRQSDCIYPKDVIGCMDKLAINYEEKANKPCRNCCVYPQNYDRIKRKYNIKDVSSDLFGSKPVPTNESKLNVKPKDGSEVSKYEYSKFKDVKARLDKVDTESPTYNKVSVFDCSGGHSGADIPKDSTSNCYLCSDTQYGIENTEPGKVQLKRYLEELSSVNLYGNGNFISPYLVNNFPSYSHVKQALIDVVEGNTGICNTCPGSNGVFYVNKHNQLPLVVPYYIKDNNGSWVKNKERDKLVEQCKFIGGELWDYNGRVTVREVPKELNDIKALKSTKSLDKFNKLQKDVTKLEQQARTTEEKIGNNKVELQKTIQKSNVARGNDALSLKNTTKKLESNLSKLEKQYETQQKSIIEKKSQIEKLSYEQPIETKPTKGIVRAYSYIDYDRAWSACICRQSEEIIDINCEDGYVFYSQKGYKETSYSYINKSGVKSTVRGYNIKDKNNQICHNYDSWYKTVFNSDIYKDPILNFEQAPWFSVPMLTAMGLDPRDAKWVIDNWGKGNQQSPGYTPTGNYSFGTLLGTISGTFPIGVAYNIIGIALIRAAFLLSGPIYGTTIPHEEAINNGEVGLPVVNTKGCCEAIGGQFVPGKDYDNGLVVNSDKGVCLCSTCPTILDVRPETITATDGSNYVVYKEEENGLKKPIDEDCCKQLASDVLGRYGVIIEWNESLGCHTPIPDTSGGGTDGGGTDGGGTDPGGGTTGGGTDGGGTDPGGGTTGGGTDGGTTGGGTTDGTTDGGTDTTPGGGTTGGGTTGGGTDGGGTTGGGTDGGTTGGSGTGGTTGGGGTTVPVDTACTPILPDIEDPIEFTINENLVDTSECQNVTISAYVYIQEPDYICENGSPIDYMNSDFSSININTARQAPEDEFYGRQQKYQKSDPNNGKLDWVNNFGVGGSQGAVSNTGANSTQKCFCCFDVTVPITGRLIVKDNTGKVIDAGVAYVDTLNIQNTVINTNANVGFDFNKWIRLTTTLDTSLLTNKNISLVLQIDSGFYSCCEYDVFIDDIQVGCEKEGERIVYNTESCPGFDVVKIIDNKRSWVYNPGKPGYTTNIFDEIVRENGDRALLEGHGDINRQFALPSPDSDIPYRQTDYYNFHGVLEKHSKLILNSKEINIFFTVCALEACPTPINLVQLETFKKTFQGFWLQFMEQFIPATRIFVAGEKWCNSPDNICKEYDPCEYEFEFSYGNGLSQAPVIAQPLVRTMPQVQRTVVPAIKPITKSKGNLQAKPSTSTYQRNATVPGVTLQPLDQTSSPLGKYTITTQRGNGGAGTGTLGTGGSIARTAPPSPLCPLEISISSYTDSTDSGLGSATASVSGATGTVTYLWSNGETTQTVTGLTAGSYTVTATDDGFDDCNVNTSVLIRECNLSLAFNTTDESAIPGGDGTVTVNVSNSYGNLTYDWSISGTSLGQYTQTATGLTAGTYTVVVTDDGLNGGVCTATGSTLLEQAMYIPSSLSTVDGYDAIIWLESDIEVFNDAGITDAVVNTDDVYQWNDQTVYNNHATQTDAGDRPSYITGDTCFQSAELVSFNDGQGDFLEITDDTSFGNLTEMTMFLYFKANDTFTSGSDVIVQYSNDSLVGGQGDGWTIDFQDPILSPTQIRFVYDDNLESPSGFHEAEMNLDYTTCNLVTIRLSGTTIDMWTGDTKVLTSVGNGDGMDAPAGGFPLTIGANYLGSLASPLDFGTYILYEGPLSDSGIASVQDYILSKYASSGPLAPGTPLLDLNSSLEVYSDDGVTLATDGQDVLRWGDQSGNDNDAYQYTGATRPSYHTTGGTQDQPYIFLDDFNGIGPEFSEWMHIDNSSAQFDTQELTLFAVLEPKGTSPSTGEIVISNQCGSGGVLYDGWSVHIGSDSDSFNFQMESVSSDSEDVGVYGPAYTGNTTQVMSWRFKAGTPAYNFYRINDANTELTGQTTTSIDYGGASDVLLNARFKSNVPSCNDPGVTLGYDLYRLVIYDSFLDKATVDLFTQQLKDFYNIT